MTERDSRRASLGVLQRGDVLDAPATGEHVVGVREQMVRLEVGLVQLQQREPVVDRVGQSEPLDALVSQRETAVRDDAAALLDLEPDAAVAEDRAIPARERTEPICR